MKSKLTLLAAAALASGIITLHAEDAPKPPPPAGGGGAPQDPRARFEAFIKSMDTNGDGKISKEEWDAFQKKQSDERFAAMDTNKDGVLDTAEIEEAMKKAAEMRGRSGMPGAPNGFRRPEGSGENAEGGSRRRPGGDNAQGSPQGGRPSAADGQRPGGSQGGGMRGGPLGEVMRKVFESGQVTKEEYMKAAEESFTQLDTNKDGKVTREELEASMQRMREQMGNRGQGGPPGGAPSEGGTRGRPQRPEADAPKPKDGA